MKEDLVEVIADMMQKVSKEEGKEIDRANATKMALRIIKNALYPNKAT